MEEEEVLTDPKDPLGLEKKLKAKQKQGDPLGLEAKLLKKKEPTVSEPSLNDGSTQAGLDVSQEPGPKGAKPSGKSIESRYPGISSEDKEVILKNENVSGWTGEGLSNDWWNKFGGGEVKRESGEIGGSPQGKSQPSGKSTESNWFTKLGDTLAAPVESFVRGGIAALTDMLPGMVAAGEAGMAKNDYENVIVNKAYPPTSTPMGPVKTNIDDDMRKAAITNYVNKVGPEQYKIEKDAYELNQLRRRADLLKYSDQQDKERKETMGDTPQTTGEIKDIKTALQWLGGAGGNAIGTAPAMIAGPVFPFLMEKGEAYKEGLGKIQEQTGLSRDEILALDLDKAARENSDISGSINSGLEMAGNLAVFGRFIPKNLASKFVSKVVSSKIGAPAVAAMGEGTTELIQAIDTKLAAYMSTGKYADVFEAANAITPEEWEQIRQEGYTGAAGGTVISAGGGLIQGQQRASRLADIKNERANRVTPSPAQVVTEARTSVKSADDTQGALDSADKIVAATETYKPGDTVELSTEVTNKDENVADLTLSEQKSENKVIENTLSEQGQQPPRDITTKSDEDIERRMLDLEGKTMFGSPELSEYNTLEKEMEKREWNSVFSVPIQEAKSAIDNLIKKEKEMPNGYGAFIEKRDASESKQIIEKYSDKKSISDNDIKKDFKEALMGRPSTWYADGLKLRESANLAAERGIEMSDLLAEVEQEFVKDGYDPKTAKEVIAGYLAKINPTASKSTISEPTGETPSLATENKSPEAQVQEGTESGQGAAMELTSTVGENYVKRDNRWFVKDSEGIERPLISDNPNKTAEEQNTELAQLKELKAQLDAEQPVKVDLSPTGKSRIAEMEAFSPEGRVRKWLFGGGQLLWNSKSQGEGKPTLKGLKDETGYSNKERQDIKQYVHDTNGMSVEQAAEQLAAQYQDRSPQEYRNAIIEVFSSDPKKWYEQQVRDEDPDYAMQEEQRFQEAGQLNEQIKQLETQEEGVKETNQQLYENERRVNYGSPATEGQAAGEQVASPGSGGQAQVQPRESIRKNGDANKSKQALEELKSKNLTHVPGLGMGANQAKGTYISTEDQNRYETEDKKPVKVKVNVQKPFVSEDNVFYDIQREIIQSRFGKEKIEDLTETEADLLAEMVTEHFTTEGFDSIYMPQSETQEGELIVFDRSKVTIMDDARIEYENAVHSSTQTTLQLEFVPDAEFLKTDKPIELREKQKKVRKDLARLNQLIKCR
jgi:hypothetical protein